MATTLVAVRVPNELLEQVDATGGTRSQVIIEALRSYLGGAAKKPEPGTYGAVERKSAAPMINRTPNFGLRKPVAVEQEVIYVRDEYSQD